MKQQSSIIVTGGAGFIGSALVWGLNRAGYKNIVIVDNLASSEKWRNLVNRRYSSYMHRDNFLKKVLDNALKVKPAAIIHLGACSSTTETDADFLMANNTEYSKILCDYALANGARFINASSAATYGDGKAGFQDGHEHIENLKPLNMYGYSKHLFDIWAKNNDLLGKIVSLKFFNVYGPNEYHKGNMASVIFKAFNQITENGRIELFKSNTPEYADGEQLRDFVYVKDCVNIILHLLANPQINGILNVGTGTPRSWNDLAKAVFAAMGLPENIEYREMPASLSKKYQNFTQADMAWQKKLMPAFKFYTLEEGVKDYVQNYLQNSDLYL